MSDLGKPGADESEYNRKLSNVDPLQDTASVRDFRTPVAQSLTAQSVLTAKPADDVSWTNLLGD